MLGARQPGPTPYFLPPEDKPPPCCLWSSPRLLENWKPSSFPLPHRPPGCSRGTKRLHLCPTWPTRGSQAPGDPEHSPAWWWPGPRGPGAQPYLVACPLSKAMCSDCPHGLGHRVGQSLPGEVLVGRALDSEKLVKGEEGVHSWVHCSHPQIPQHRFPSPADVSGR